MNEDKEFIEKNSCCICFDNMANAVNMSCGHGGICIECGRSVLETQLKVCHLCREPVICVLQMDLTYQHQNFVNVVSATYVDYGQNDGIDDSGNPIQN